MRLKKSGPRPLESKETREVTESHSEAGTGSEHDPQMELRCRVDSAMLGPLREFVSSVARHLDFPEEQIAQIEICVDEACANAMEHAYSKCFEVEGKDKSAHVLIVELLFNGNQEFTIRVTDHGCGTAPGIDEKMQSLEEYLDAARDRYRGLGFHLMRKFMDRVNVKSSPGQGTTVEMTKYRR